MKICPENPDLANVAQKYPALYMKTCVRFALLAATGSATSVTTHCCVYMATLSIFITVLTTDVPQQYKRNALLRFRGNSGQRMGHSVT
jgi:hypothetical protein